MMTLLAARWILFTRVVTLFFVAWVKSIHQDCESGNSFFIQVPEILLIFNIFSFIQ